MTKTYEYQKDGSIIWREQLDADTVTISRPFTPDSDEFNAIVSEGVEIAPCVEPVKTAEHLKAKVVQELKSLDASSRTLANALLGDQWAIDEIKRLEAEKVILRDKLKSL